jgi:putative ABC transport system permease protein
MDSLFGIPMDLIMWVSVGLLVVTLATVGLVALLNRVMFTIGLRNIPRRVAQTVLIIIGLMLSTLIISAAFTTGDTVDHSISNEIFDGLGSVDEVIEFESEEGTLGGADVRIPERLVEELEETLGDDPDIDGIMPVLSEEVPVFNVRTHLSVPSVSFMGLDETRLEGFPDIVDREGQPLDLASLADDELYLSEKTAKGLDAQAGDEVTVFFENEEFSFRVVDIAENRTLVGDFGPEQSDGMVARLGALQSAFGREGDVDFIAISNRGGVRDALPLTETVTAKLETAIESEELDLTVEPLKQDLVDMAEQLGNGLMTFFLIMGLFSIAAGVLLIVMIFVMLAAERKTEMGISRAVGTKRRHLVQMYISEGMGYNLMSALVGVFLGVLVALLLTGIMAALFSEFDISIEAHVTGRSLIISYSLGVFLTFATVAFSSWQVSRLNVVRAIRDLPEPEARPGRRSLLVAIGLGLLGGLLILAGLGGGQGFPYALGATLIFLAVAIAGRYLRFPERPLFTVLSLILLVYWALSAGSRIPPELEYGEEMFFFSGIVMVATATFVIVYNAHMLLAVLTKVGGRMGRIVPALKTAVAYPLASKFRTGMTMAMIGLVVFALSVMSTMNANFSRVFLSDEARGGWDLVVEENVNNPMPSLRAALDEEGSVDTSQFAAVGKLGLARPYASELRQNPEDEFEYYVVWGADDSFLAEGNVPLQARASGYEDDAAVWNALSRDPNLAVVDAFATEEAGFNIGGPAFKVEGIEEGQEVFEPIAVDVKDSATGETGRVQIIGVTQYGASITFFGVITTKQLVDRVFGGADLSYHYVRLTDPDAAEEVARDVEAALYTRGVQASSIKADREEDMAFSRGFFYLLQAFMGLGLVVGVAAVGVIAFRTVVERRQQIGMLRAIGYTRGQVALSFLMESSFVTILGILCGLGMGILLAFVLLTSEVMSGLGFEGVYIPWAQISLIALFAYGASLVMTFIPSRQAASIPIAEALRYE